jgi:hypothetical protein
MSIELLARPVAPGGESFAGGWGQVGGRTGSAIEPVRSQVDGLSGGAECERADAASASAPVKEAADPSRRASV